MKRKNILRCLFLAAAACLSVSCGGGEGGNDALEVDGAEGDGTEADTGPDDVPDDTELDGALVSSITQSGITWSFGEPVQAGRFANGDFWMIGPVTVTGISPDASVSQPVAAEGICNGLSAGNEACRQHCAANAPADHTAHCTADNVCLCARARNGWEVNPVYEGGQGFDDRAQNFDGRLIPPFPYTASAGESIVKVVSLDPETADCRPCLVRAAALTVVGEVPPDGGASVFRPPYVGSEKPLYSTTALRTDLLPTLAPVEETPALEEIRARFAPLQLDHKTGMTCRRLHPQEHMPDYGCDIGRDIGDGALRLMLDDPPDARLPALVVLLQYGIDMVHAALLGRSFAEGCDGHQTGYKLLLTFTAALFGDEGMAAVARDESRYEEDAGLYFSETAGLDLYGYRDAYWSEQGYWARIAAGNGSRSNADPYGWIDGGEGLSNYQGIVSPTWKGEALALHLMPSLQEIWDDPLFLRYADRWVNHGYWTQPDPCAPADGVCSGGDNAGAACTTASAPDMCTGTDATCDGSVYWDPDGTLGLENHYGVTYGPDGAGGCILDTDSSDGTGRFPQNHGAEADGPNRRSPFQGHLWDAYRGPSCFDGACEAGESAATCPFDCGP